MAAGEPLWGAETRSKGGRREEEKRRGEEEGEGR